MMDPELMKLAQEQMSRMSPDDLANIQQQMMSNPDLVRMASESMKNMSQQDLLHAAQQLRQTEDISQIGRNIANTKPEDIASMLSGADAQMNYQLSSAQLLKKQGNDLHTRGRFTDASHKYLLAIDNLKAVVPSDQTRALSLACSLNLMSCYLKTKQYTDCVQQGSQVLASDPKNVKALYRRGQAYKELGHFKDAVTDLNKALEVSPGDETILDVLRDVERLAGESGEALNQTTRSIVQVGPESVSKLKVTVLEGDFNEEDDDDWTKEHFESHEVKERDGKRPLLTGDLNVILKDGVGTLGDLTFTDNSSWIRSRKFRLGVKVATGHSDEIRVREAKTEAFAVKDHRGELYKKHYPPALNDEVWRLDRIAKDGALHKKLIKAEVMTVEDFLRVLVREPQRLRHILGSGMSNRMWDNTVEHAKTCVLDGKLYVYYNEGTHSTGVVFNHIYELIGLISVGQFVPLEALTHHQKISVDTLIKKAYENWNQVMEYDGKVLNSIIHSSKQPDVSAASTSIADRNTMEARNFTAVQNGQLYTPQPNSQAQTGNSHHNVVPHLIEFPFIRLDPMADGVYSGNNDFQPEEPSYISNNWSRPKNGHGFDDFFSDDIRLRSSEMLETDDMQRLLKTFGVNVGFDQSSDEACYSHNVSYESQMDREHGYERGRSSGKAVVGWLKLKAALRWGIFVRKRAAQRRAQLVELDD